MNLGGECRPTCKRSQPRVTREYAHRHGVLMSLVPVTVRHIDDIRVRRFAPVACTVMPVALRQVGTVFELAVRRVDGKIVDVLKCVGSRRGLGHRLRRRGLYRLADNRRGNRHQLVNPRLYSVIIITENGTPRLTVTVLTTDNSGGESVNIHRFRLTDRLGFRHGHRNQHVRGNVLTDRLSSLGGIGRNRHHTAQGGERGNSRNKLLTHDSPHFHVRQYTGYRLY
nr:MAG TPA: hypothetical protein [Caudoviricetes sp.]